MCNINVSYFLANFLPLKQQLQKDQGLFKQRVDDIQLRITSPSLTDKDTNYGMTVILFMYSTHYICLLF